MKKLVAVLALGAIFTGCDQQKTAYVDTQRLLQDYTRMQEMEAEFTGRSESLRQEIDSVARGFQQEVQAYQEEMGDLTQAQRQEREQELMQKQQMIQQRQQMASGQLRQESSAVVDSIMTEVKDFVKAYGEEHGYTYIFGSTENANIMYAKEGLDITDEILDELNEGTTGVVETED